MENKIDRLFWEKLGGMEVPPAPGSWEAINRGAAGQKNAVHWVRWAAAAVLLLTLGLGYLLDRTLRRSEPESSNLSAVVESAPARDGQGQPAAEGSRQNNQIQPEQITAVADPGLGEGKPGPRQAAAKMPVDVKPEEVHDEPEAQSLLTALIPVEDEVSESVVGTAVTEDQVPQPEAGAVLLADNGMQPQADATDFEALPIRIVYKKGREPEPEPYDKGLTQRGMEKLTALTDELKLSEEAREKLRNTKEDLLAFNFRNLINRKNNEDNELEE